MNITNKLTNNNMNSISQNTFLTQETNVVQEETNVVQEETNVVQEETNKDKKKKKNKSGKEANKSGKETNKPLNPVAKLALQRLKLIEDEEIRKRSIQEEIDRKQRDEEERELTRLKAIQYEKDKKIEAKKNKILVQKLNGTYKNKNDKNKERKFNEYKSRSVNVTSVNKIEIPEKEQDISLVKHNDVIAFRSPIICIMGHVDTGKTKLLDKIRDTNVQEGEVAGITQQIGATFIPHNSLIEKTKQNIIDINIPGLLMIDTPGHEVFSNLRKLGLSLCDITIVVIDLVHGVEKQTLEVINLLMESDNKFIIALNKIDRLYGWNSVPNSSITDALKNNESCINEFNNKLNEIKCAISSQGINSELYWNNNSPDDTINICPLSAITGEGVSDLLFLLINTSQTELINEITIDDNFKCIVMEKKMTDGFATTLDVILINGTIREGDYIIIKTLNGNAKTRIRNLLTPPPNRESRVTSIYNNNSKLTGSISFKLVANNLENVLIGSEIIIDNNNTVLCHNNIDKINKYKLDNIGIMVYASSEGSLEASMNYLQNVCKPYVSISDTHIGSVKKKHINKMIISNKTDKAELNFILAFDVDTDEDVIGFASQHNINIITDYTIYRLYDQYNIRRNDIINMRKEANKHLLVYPCVFQILKNHIYNKKGPFIFGVKIMEGELHLNTPIITDERLFLGKITSIQKEEKNINIASKGSEVCIKIEDNVENITYGRQFDFKNILYSNISAQSIDIFNNHFKDEIFDNNKLNNTGKLLYYIKTKI